MSNTPKPATSRQLSFLRALAEKTGTTFTTPRSVTEASCEIQRLLARTGQGNSFAERQTIAGDRGAATERGSDVTAPEVAGHGSSAHWGADGRRERDSDRELPTRAQCEQLDRLAKKHGRTCTVPVSRADAARKIAWLKNGAQGPEPENQQSGAARYDGTSVTDTWGVATRNERKALHGRRYHTI